MNNHPFIYQINFRVWFNKLKSTLGLNSILEIPDTIWLDLRGKGFDYVWLMGIWETVPQSVKKYCFEPFLIKEYEQALPDWREEDVIGSPYAINCYNLNPLYGSKNDLLKLKQKINSYGLKLILDFIPNHFHAETSLIKSNPELFLNADEELLALDNQTYFRSEIDNNIYCHGRDPYYPAWQDTVQVNYFNEVAQEFMTNQLLTVSELCDGLRCDMVMLSVNDVFEKTWAPVISKRGLQKPENEFWDKAIKNVKSKRDDFIFLAEVYWGMEWDLQQKGFDYTYDKTLYDRILAGNVSAIKDHLKADMGYQLKSLRFLENHDEKRSFNTLGIKKIKAASTILNTIPGAKLFFDGQLNGYSVKLPVQLGRAPVEESIKEIENHYNKLFKITNKEIFKKGSWNLLETTPAWEGDNSYNSILSWAWHLEEEERIICVNYSDQISTCRIYPTGNFDKDYVQLDDDLNDLHFRRNFSDLKRIGLYIQLEPFATHLFKLS